MFRRMVGQEHRMQTVGGMQAGMAGAEVPDGRPAVGIDGRNDHRADAGLAGAFDDRATVAGEGVVIEMDVTVDESGHDLFFVDWQRVLRFLREDNVTSVS
jgi:hypothetical protein